MIYQVKVGEVERAVSVERKGSGYLVRVGDGEAFMADVSRSEGGLISLIWQGLSYELGVAEQEDGWEIDVYGTAHFCRAEDPQRMALQLGGGADEGTLTTSMPGRVLRILVGEGDRVEKNQPVLIIEAMKMENEMKAPAEGVVACILVEEGQTVDAQTALLRVE